MTCEVYKILLHELDDETLNDDLKPHIKNHIHTCESCKAYSSGLKRAMDLGRLMPDPKPRTALSLSEPSSERPSVAETLKHLLSPRPMAWAASVIIAVFTSTMIVMHLPGNKQAASLTTTNDTVSFQVSVDQPTVVKFNFHTDKALQGATLVVATTEGAEFVGQSEIVNGQRVLHTTIDLKPGDNLISVVVKSSQVGKQPLMASIFHPEFSKSTLIEMNYEKVRL